MQELIKNFDFNGHGVRVITNEKNQVFFVAKDVCEVLGYAKASSTIVQTHCKTEGVTEMVIPSNGGEQRQFIINESNLYRLVMKSKKKEAIDFQDWVCDEVLPSIRKTGKYDTEQKEAMPTNFLEALKLLVEKEESNLRLEMKVDNLSTALDSLVEWVSIIKVSQFNKVHEKAFNWRVLKRKSEEMGFIIKRSESPRFGFQNLYHVNTFKACYPQYNYKFLNDSQLTVR